MEDPSIIMPLLNSQISQVKANKRMSAFLSTDGSIFLMGKNFNVKPAFHKEELLVDMEQGIPKRLPLVCKIKDIALGA
jgi:hypothetical protein